MRALRILYLVTLTLVLASSLAVAQSLAEVAKKEKERRAKNKEEAKKVITDRELVRSYGGLPTATAAPSSGEAQTEGEGSETTEGEGEQEQEDETQTREYWQNRVQTTKDKITRLEQELNQEDWGEGQRVGVDPRGQNNLARRQQLEQQLAAARAELNAIRQEARRARVPNGWVR